MAAVSSVKLAPGAVVCNECELVGDITIGSKTVIHPKARIIAEGGPIIIGESNLIEEQVLIINRKTADAKQAGASQQVMMIGNYNVFEVGACSESLHVGDYNILEAKFDIFSQTGFQHSADEWLHRRCHVRGDLSGGDSREHGDSRAELPTARSVGKAHAANSAAGFLDEGLAKLSPSEEAHKTVVC